MNNANILSGSEAQTISNTAHDFAQAWIDRGAKFWEDKISTAKTAARMHGFEGRKAELFVERCVGHWMNVAAGTRGV